VTEGGWPDEPKPSMVGVRTFREQCAWPGCHRAISWKQVWCYPHWKKVPEEDRQARTDAIREARKVLNADGEVAVAEPVTEVTTDDAASVTDEGRVSSGESAWEPDELPEGWENL